MKRTNPIEKAITLLIISVFAISGILAFVSHYDKSKTPMNGYVDYILEKHNDNCQYEIGECTESLCSHYHN
jgi:hypothetical protein